MSTAQLVALLLVILLLQATQIVPYKHFVASDNRLALHAYSP